ncbi:MAG: lactate utilization protein [Bryobacteraceae bacterium]|nr:lactate utilization protein [Bryobacteraceae bacterium]
MIGKFRQAAEAAGAEVLEARTPEAALATLARILKEEGVGAGGRTAVWPAGPLRQRFHPEILAQMLPGLALEVTREAAAAAHAGITEFECGAAATGTLVQDASAVAQRLASTLPPVHVALLPAGAIVADIGAALRRFDPARAAFLALVTGPSRTADIERVLTIGVHGPRRLVIILYGEESGHA